MLPTRGHIQLVAALTLLLTSAQAAWAADALPDGAINRLGSRSFRHLAVKTGGVGVLYSPAGNYLASWTDDQVLRLWQPDKGQEVRQFRDDQAPIKAAAFSRDGRLLATGNSMGAVRLWEVETGRQFQEIAARWEKEVTSLTFGADGKSLLTGSLDRTVKLWDVENNKLARPFGDAKQQRVTAVAVSPAGDLAAAGCRDGAVAVWDLLTGKEVRALRGDGTSVFGLSFTGDGKQLIVGGQGIVRLYDLESGKDLRQFGKPITDAVDSQNNDRCVALAPDGATLAVAGLRGVRIYDFATAKELRPVGAVRRATSVSFSHDGKAVAFDGAGQEIRRGDPSTGKELRPDGGHRDKVLAAVYSADGRRLYSGSADKTVMVWDAVEGKVLRTLVGHDSNVTALALSPDGKVLASGDGGGDVRLWDPETGKELAPVIKALNGRVWSMLFSADGKMLATGGADTMVRLWDWAKERKISDLDGHQGGAMALCFGKDGQTLAVGSGVGTVHLWALDSDTDIKQFGQAKPQPGNIFRMLDEEPAEFQPPTAIAAVRFSPDWKQLRGWNSGGTYLVWDVETAGEKRRVDGPREGVSEVAFAPDGLTVAVATRKKTLQIWELATGQLRGEYAGHEGNVWAVSFSPDGRRLVSASEDCTLVQWDVTGRLKDGKFAVEALAEKELDGLWADLISEDAARAHRAIWGLVAADKPALPWLRERVRPTPLDPKRVDKLIKQLDNADFVAREEAREALEELGDLAEKALEASLANKPPLEMRDRLEKLIAKLKKERDALNPNRLRVVRLVEILGQVGGPDARRILMELAEAPVEARLTEEVKALAHEAADRLGPPEEKEKKEEKEPKTPSAP